MELEWDENKRQKNLRERGLDFSDAARMDLTTSLTMLDARKDYREDRFVSYGFIDGRLHVMC